MIDREHFPIDLDKLDFVLREELVSVKGLVSLLLLLRTNGELVRPSLHFLPDGEIRLESPKQVVW
jgi:hypothetical protein